MGINEFNYQIDRLIIELEKIRKRAKKNFAAATQYYERNGFGALLMITWFDNMLSS